MFLSGRCVLCPGTAADAGVLCPACAGEVERARVGLPEGWPRVVFRLDPAVRELIARLKYWRERRLAAWLAERIAPLVPRGADALTWIPATPARIVSRGYDQAAELARAVTKLTGVPLVPTLARDQTDERQTERDRAGRARGPALREQRSVRGLIVVIDDVITTGSTLRRAEAVLTRAGADRVLGVAVAATPRRGSAANEGSSGPSAFPQIGSTIRLWM